MTTTAPTPSGLKRRQALAAALLLPLAAAALPVRAAAGGKRVFFVCRATSKAQPSDAKAVAHLQSLGYAVTLAAEDAPAPAVGSQDLVVISSTVGAHSIEGRYRALAIPVLTWEPYVLPELDMTDNVQDRDFGNDTKVGQLYLYVVNPVHPLGAGVQAGLLKPFADTIKTMNWGRPGRGAQVIATMPGEPWKAMIFGYEKGAALQSGADAPARRVMFFLHDTTFDLLNPAGLQLFDAAVAWAAGR